MIIKQGDLLPHLKVTCSNEGKPVDLTAALSVEFVCRKDGGDELLWTRAGVGNAEGVATYVWQAGDTDDTGRLFFEVKVTWPDGEQTFPAVSYLPVDVIGDLG